MFNISSFLEKFSKNLKSSEVDKQKILDVIEKNTNLVISQDDLEIKNFVVNIKASPGVKNKIFINKRKILEDIESSIPTKIVDIR